MDYPIVPGRSLVTETAKELRLKYLIEKKIELKEIPKDNLKVEDIRNNIESHVGSVEIPLGLVGPLLFKNNDEHVHTLIGTLEGALVASMNRGAKCVSLSGGFSACVLHQKMIRTPMFTFNNLNDCIQFVRWIKNNFSEIKRISESFSNHAKLENIIPYVIGKSAHIKFVYLTGDASGQNMTTSCTWQAIMWIQEQFRNETNIDMINYIIEGNGASDKKVSNFSINHGRGIHVVAEVHLKEDVIKKVLRTTSKEFVRCFGQSVAMSQIDGMVGYNINIANTIAGIFASTGQDLACIHESACGVLNIEQTDDGLYLSLNLPSLVIGTVGGGTHLKKQKEALALMGCEGNNKVNRFAQLIAGFALSLEISTFAAIVSGQFAKSHEKLGRNKPKDWLLKSEINVDFLNKVIKNEKISKLSLTSLSSVDNGIIISLTSKVSKKLIGFIPVQFEREGEVVSALIKSKPLDKEVYKGLHFMASNINIELPDLIVNHADNLEYKNCHLKELELYELLEKLDLNISPRLYGAFDDEKREVYLIVNELLDSKELVLFNSENHPERWEENNIFTAIKGINDFHLKSKKEVSNISSIDTFQATNSKALYEKLIDMIINESESNDNIESGRLLSEYLVDLEVQPQLEKTIIHNDYNPRNIAIRKNGDLCVYDWELSVIGLPHRDIVEFLSFTLNEDFTKEELLKYLKYHYELNSESNVSWDNWKEGYAYAIKEYLVTRVSFYLVGSILMNYEFAPRIYKVALKMLKLL
jgi:hydroxymethylglutaryl-CoA reductase (NADPH)|tara:strand:- start:1116 stop:3383 length:2268 start_codon:yes stop_codon:yes gene_type:complete